MEVVRIKISEIEPNSKVLNLVGTIAHLDAEGKTPNGVKVQEGILSDVTGQVKLSLWDEQVGLFKTEDKVIITTGWCKEFKEEMQVSTGKFGKITKVPAEKDEA